MGTSGVIRSSSPVDVITVPLSTHSIVMRTSHGIVVPTYLTSDETVPSPVTGDVEITRDDFSRDV